MRQRILLRKDTLHMHRQKILLKQELLNLLHTMQ